PFGILFLYYTIRPSFPLTLLFRPFGLASPFLFVRPHFPFALPFGLSSDAPFGLTSNAPYRSHFVEVYEDRWVGSCTTRHARSSGRWQKGSGRQW
ncbi:hypothetical protein VIGAN_01420800, partial [Vigna angularis var. angularis]